MTRSGEEFQADRAVQLAYNTNLCYTLNQN